jgi:hypothetical protein
VKRGTNGGIKVRCKKVDFGSVIIKKNLKAMNTK